MSVIAIVLLSDIKSSIFTVDAAFFDCYLSQKIKKNFIEILWCN